MHRRLRRDVGGRVGENPGPNAGTATAVYPGQCISAGGDYVGGG